MAKDGLQLFGGDWTQRKLDALERYLRAYARALSKRSFRRMYIDAFAGTGYRQQRAATDGDTPSMFDDDIDELAAPESQRFLDGSAKIALKVEPAFHRFLFLEKEIDKIAELQKLKDEFPNKAHSIEIQAGDANVAIRKLCQNWDKPATRGVLFIDPFGMQADWSTIAAIAATGCIDTWILFPFAPNRLMRRDKRISPAWQLRLNKMFGTNEWESRFYKKENFVDIFGDDSTVVEKALTLEGLGAFYAERLRSVFPIVAPNPCTLRSANNRPLFQLFFAAANPGKGGELALKIAKHILDKI